MIKYILMSCIIILFVGCESISKKPEIIVETKIVEKKCVFNYPDEIITKKFDWLVFEYEGVSHILISPIDYEKLTYNNSEMKRYMKQMKEVLKKCEVE